MATQLSDPEGAIILIPLRALFAIKYDVTILGPMNEDVIRVPDHHLEGFEGFSFHRRSE